MGNDLFVHCRSGRFRQDGLFWKTELSSGDGQP
jgi:hypothetical protein